MAKAATGRMLVSMLVASVLFLAPLGAQERAADEGWVPERDEVIEGAGVAYGLTFGNLIYPGLKAATMALAAPQAALAWLLSLGDTEQARTIWEAQTEGPYYIGPEEARRALGIDAEPAPYQDYDRELTE